MPYPVGKLSMSNGKALVKRRGPVLAILNVSTATITYCCILLIALVAIIMRSRYLAMLYPRAGFIGLFKACLELNEQIKPALQDRNTGSEHE